MSDTHRRGILLEPLFIPQKKEIRRWSLSPGGRGLLVAGPSGRGKSTLLAEAFGSGASDPDAVIRLDCFPPRGAAELLVELSLAFLARGEKRLHEIVSADSPFNVQLEIAKELLAGGRFAVWFDDIDFLGMGSLSEYPSQRRERSEFLRILGVAAERGARVVVTAREADEGSEGPGCDQGELVPAQPGHCPHHHTQPKTLGLVIAGSGGSGLG